MHKKILTKEAADKPMGEHVIIPDGHTEIEGYKMRQEIKEILKTMTCEEAIEHAESKEFQTLTEEKRRIFLEETMSKVNKKIPIIGGWCIEESSILSGLRNEGKIPNECECEQCSPMHKKILTKEAADKLTGEHIVIPNGYTGIEVGAFERRKDVLSITIPDSVTNIAGLAFAGCVALTSINLPDSMTTIWGATFAGCTALTSISLPGSVTTILDLAFSSCKALTSITIPDSVTTIGRFAFKECPDLTIHCREGSYAHTYAVENDIAFKLMSYLEAEL